MLGILLFIWIMGMISIFILEIAPWEKRDKERQGLTTNRDEAEDGYVIGVYSIYKNQDITYYPKKEDSYLIKPLEDD